MCDGCSRKACPICGSTAEDGQLVELNDAMSCWKSSNFLSNDCTDDLHVALRMQGDALAEEDLHDFAELPTDHEFSEWLHAFVAGEFREVQRQLAKSELSTKEFETDLRCSQCLDEREEKAHIPKVFQALRKILGRMSPEKTCYYTRDIPRLQVLVENEMGPLPPVLAQRLRRVFSSFCLVQLVAGRVKKKTTVILPSGEICQVSDDQQ